MKLSEATEILENNGYILTEKERNDKFWNALTENERKIYDCLRHSHSGTEQMARDEIRKIIIYAQRILDSCNG